MSAEAPNAEGPRGSVAEEMSHGSSTAGNSAPQLLNSSASQHPAVHPALLEHQPPAGAGGGRGRERPRLSISIPGPAGKPDILVDTDIQTAGFGRLILGQNAMKGILQDNARKLASEPGAVMKQRMKALQEQAAGIAAQSANYTESIFQSHRPIAILFRGTLLPILLLIYFGVWVWGIAIVLHQITDNSVVKYTHYEFKLTRFGDATDGFSGPGIDDFKLTLDGCISQVEPASEIVLPGKLRKSFTEETEMNGWSVFGESNSDTAFGELGGPSDTKAEGHFDLNEISFELHASNDGDNWKQIASSHWRYTNMLRIRFLNEPFKFPAIQEAEGYKQDLRAPVGQIIFRFAYPLVQGLAVFMALVLILLQRYWVASFIVVQSIGLMGILALVGGIFSVIENQPRDCFLPFTYFVLDIWIVCVLSIGVVGRNIVENSFSYGLLKLLATVIQLSLVYQDMGYMWMETPPDACGFLLIGILGIMVKSWKVRDSERSIASDRKRYDEAWHALLEIPNEKHALDSLEKLLRMLRKNVSKSNGHYHSIPVPMRARARGSIFANLLDSTTKQSEFEPVRDLDQLYRQASGLQLFISGKVKQWTGSSNGLLKVRVPESSVSGHPKTRSSSMNEITKDDVRSSFSYHSMSDSSTFAYKRLHDIHVEQGEAILWQGPKKPDRSISKVVLAYAGDAAKLVDICRERIIFESIEDLLQCCQSIIIDKDIIIKRVKNRMAISYDSSKTAGYRFVLFNFCIATAETARLQLDHHVCEIQLVLKSFSDVQLASSASHSGYIMFRNARALKEAGSSTAIRKTLRRTARETAALSSLYHRGSHPHSSFGGSMSQHRGSQRGSMASSIGSHRPSVDGDIHHGSSLDTTGGAHGSGTTQASAEWSHTGSIETHVNGHQSYRSKKKQQKIQSLQAVAQQSVRDFGPASPSRAMSPPRHHLSSPTTPALSRQGTDDTDLNGKGTGTVYSTPNHTRHNTPGSTPAISRQGTGDLAPFITKEAVPHERHTAEPGDGQSGPCSESVNSQNNGHRSPPPHTNGGGLGSPMAGINAGNGPKSPTLKVHNELDELLANRSGSGDTDELIGEIYANREPSGPSGNTNGTNGHSNGNGHRHASLSPTWRVTPSSTELTPKTPQDSPEVVRQGSIGTIAKSSSAENREALELVQRLNGVLNRSGSDDTEQNVSRSPSVVRRFSTVALNSFKRAFGSHGTPKSPDMTSMEALQNSLPLSPGGPGSQSPPMRPDAYRLKIQATWRASRMRLNPSESAGNLRPGASEADMETLDGTLENLFVTTMKSAGGVLDQKIPRFVHEALAHSNAVSACFTSSPISSAVSFRSIQAVFVITALLFFGECGFLWYMLIVEDVHAVTWLKFHVSSASSVSMSNLMEFGLLNERCLVDTAMDQKTVLTSQEDPTLSKDELLVQFDGSPAFNGWYMLFDRPFDDKITVMASIADHKEQEQWQCIIPPYDRDKCEETVQWYEQTVSGLAFDSDQRSRMVSFDLRPRWAHYMAIVGMSFFEGAAYLFAAVCGIIRQERKAVIAMVASHTVAFLLALDAAAILFSDSKYNLGSRRLAIIWQIKALLELCLVAGLTRFQQHTVMLHVVFSASSLVISYFAGPAVFVGPAWQYTAYLGHAFLMAASVLVVVLRPVILDYSRYLILRDKDNYDNLWADISKEEEAIRQIEILQSKVAEIGGSQEAPRQMGFGQPDKSDPVRGGLQRIKTLSRLMSGKFGNSQVVPRDPSTTFQSQSSQGCLADQIRPVQSLDQLFAQAKVMHCILKDKVKNFAEKSNGYLRGGKMFLVNNQIEKGKQGFIQWNDVKDDPALLQHIRWAALKSPERAIEKHLRSYGGDVSRLTDICRQSLVFDCLEDLNKCLDAIVEDREVSVVRVKNRYHPDYDSARSAGYRDVAINMVIVSAETTDLKLQHHVCELQLILRRFADLKSEEGHKRYVEFRNARAE